MSPKIIGIRFPDNDFHNTITAFLECLRFTGLESYEGYQNNGLNKEKIVELFNKSAAGLYWLCQNRLRYTNENFDPIKYLTISVDNVFLDEEVSNYIKEHKGWDNGEFHVLDCQVHVPYIYSV